MSDKTSRASKRSRISLEELPDSAELIGFATPDKGTGRKRPSARAAEALVPAALAAAEATPPAAMVQHADGDIVASLLH